MVVAGSVSEMWRKTPAGPELELLAPAGDEECLQAAVAAGADAVYFGLSAGFNARAKAASVGVGDLERVLGLLHRHGVRGYVTFNTLVLERELGLARDLLAAVAVAGADAVIVQDLGVASLCRAVAPELPLHASTQMTLSSPGAAAVARALGVRRVILPRELSLEEIRRYRAATESDLELECFVHGALCMSYSGQCLISATWGRRSANRGLCAQPCRMAYELVVDGKLRPLGDERYLLAPKDLAAHARLAELAAAGVTSFKIEGRYKGPEYVAAVVSKYRAVLDGVRGGRPAPLSRTDVEELAFIYSRGFSDGFLKGPDHQELSHGRYPSHRGLLIGHVDSVRGFSVFVRPVEGAPEVRPGDWMLFGQGDPEGDEPKGGVFSIGPKRGDLLDIRFGDPGPDLRRIRPGDELWKSHDSAVKRRFLACAKGRRRLPVCLRVSGRVGEPLIAEATDALGRVAQVTSDMPLAAATSSPLSRELIVEKLGAFGDSDFALGRCELQLEGALALSPAALKRMRRELVTALTAQEPPRPVWQVRREVDVTAVGRAEPPGASNAAPARGLGPGPESELGPQLIVLCRSPEQVSAAAVDGAREIYLDMPTLPDLRDALARARQAGVRALLATPRIEKPADERLVEAMAKLEVDGVLARHLAAVRAYAQGYERTPGFTLHGDASLNVANAITGRRLLEMGLRTVTPATDLDVEAVLELVAALPRGAVEIVLAQHVPLSHSEYCLYAHHLSKGRNMQECGRPCREHRLALRDHKGFAHPVHVDMHCRNTVFNADVTSLVAHVPRLRELGVRRFRVELLEGESYRAWRDCCR